MKRKLVFVQLMVIIALIMTCAPAAMAEDGGISAVAANTVIETASSVIGTLLLGAIGVFFVWLRGKVKSERILAAMDELEKAAVRVAGALQQDIVDGLKAASADGKLTPEEGEMLAAKSLALVKQGMTPSAKELIAAAGLDLEKLIEEQVKSAVAAMHGRAVKGAA